MFFQFVKHNSSSTRWEDNSFFEIVGNTTLEETFRRFYHATTRVLIPFVSILGIFGNILSMVILSKHGLHKCSNVLIFALALADTAYLVGITNIPLSIHEADLVHYGFYYTEPVSRAMYVLFQIFVCLETVGKVVSLLLPSLIIFERFVAVFWPFHFSRILTARRVQLAAALMYPLGIPPYVFFLPLPQFIYITDPATNVSVGLMSRSATFNVDVGAFNAVSDVYTTVCGPVSVGFVVVGCALVGVKVHLQMRHRCRMMMKSQQASDCLCSDLFRLSCLKFCSSACADDYHISAISGRMSVPDSGRKLTFSRQVNWLSSYCSQDVVLTSRTVMTPSKTQHETMTPSSLPHVTMTSSITKHETMTASNRPHVTMTSSITKHEKMTPSEFQLNKPKPNVSVIKTLGSKSNCETHLRQPNREIKTGRRESNKGLRTTKILLSVCIVYSLTAGLSFLSDMVFSMRRLGYFQGLMFHRSGILAMCVNSSANFVIYVVLNRNFRETYKRMFCWCVQ